MLGKLPLTAQERDIAVDLALHSLTSPSALERVHALQSLTDLSTNDPQLHARARGALDHALDDPSAAVRARARKLLSRLA